MNPISVGGVATPVQQSTNVASQPAPNSSFASELAKQEAATVTPSVEADADDLESINEQVEAIRDSYLSDPTADTSGNMLAMMEQAKKLML
ncbi:hypothetical protein [Ferrimonas senticii]|uniref:hypothetical protein n=1 Tax=Ferrimonas senticii TaxID=394566 RepID=UPI0004116EA3|nr:hypothetical protein [Ferrimonas senticii]